MSSADAGAVLAIYQAGLDTGQASFETQAPDWAAFDAARLADHRYVARDPGAGKVLGWVAVSAVSSRYAYAGVVEHSVYIGPGARGRGVGTALLRTLIRSTERAGIWTIESGIFPENAASLRLHRSAGFRVVGTRERLGRHRGRWRDVILLERRSPAVGVGDMTSAGRAAAPVETPRLLLEPLAVRHAAQMVQVLAAPQLYRFTGGSPPTLRELTERYQRLVAGPAGCGEGWLNWVIRQREDQRLAGTVQATVTSDPACLRAAIAWVVGTPWQGRGYATESAQALIGWLREHQVMTIVAAIHPDHAASAAVARRAGMTPTAERADGEIIWRLAGDRGSAPSHRSAPVSTGQHRSAPAAARRWRRWPAPTASRCRAAPATATGQSRRAGSARP